jgi:hypothetical protein
VADDDDDVVDDDGSTVKFHWQLVLLICSRKEKKLLQY